MCLDLELDMFFVLRRSQMLNGEEENRATGLQSTNEGKRAFVDMLGQAQKHIELPIPRSALSTLCEAGF